MSSYLSIPKKQWASVPLFFKEWRVTWTFSYTERFAVTPIWVKAKYIHSYKISERKQA
jgi:hypothetical protein